MAKEMLRLKKYTYSIVELQLTLDIGRWHKQLNVLYLLIQR